MELAELSSQLKTFGGTRSRKVLSEKSASNEGRRLTRSRSVTKSPPQSPPPNRLAEKTRRVVRDPEDELKSIYLDKKVKLVHNTLETIFEDPVCGKLFSGRKLKRSIPLSRDFRKAKQKSKLRRKKMEMSGTRGKQLKMSDEEFRQKMMSIERFINGSEDGASTKDCDVPKNEKASDSIDSGAHESNSEMELL